MWSGKGAPINPIILTKSTNRDDFYEAYAIYLMPEIDRLVAVSTKDSLKELGLFYMKKFQRNKWHHLVISYDYDNFSFYVDGKLEDRLPKKFETKFLQEDSVIIGVTANKKNNRFLNGTVDDIEFFDKVLTDDEVLALYNAPNPNKNKKIVNWILICLGIITLIITSYFYIKYKIELAVKKEKLKLELTNKLLETELRVNRASMNPHFLFNSLNTLHNFILLNDIENASDYLIKFSKLIRKILDSNMHGTIPLDLEIEILERYLEIENLRFEKNINYTIILDDAVVPSVVHIPIMMLQPFIENAIWYGLLNKQGEKKITISFSLFESNYIYCIIEDNGTGRKKDSATSIVEKKSLATTFIMQRLDLLNKIHGLKCSLMIEDKPNQQGTIVKIILPILKS
jgi:two-component sensor histidine kinase